MKNESSTRAIADSERAIAIDASTPSTTASSVAALATLRLFQAANCSCQASTSEVYQRSE